MKTWVSCKRCGGWMALRPGEKRYQNCPSCRNYYRELSHGRGRKEPAGQKKQDGAIPAIRIYDTLAAGFEVRVARERPNDKEKKWLEIM